jgi:hypothetical protein
MLCPECGTASAAFVAVEVDDPMVGDPDADSLREVWLRAGLEQTRMTRAA